MDRDAFLYFAKYYLEILPNQIIKRHKAFAARRESGFIPYWDGSQNSSKVVKSKIQEQEQLKIC